MFCKNCGKFMNDNQAICLNCGVQTGVGNGFCPNCGNPVDPNAAVCLNCGVAIKNQRVNGGTIVTGDYLNGQNKTVIALICFFFGGFGIHNFMMGETKKGVFRLCMCLVCGLGGIFALIDFIKILTNTYVVDPEKLV